MVVAGGGVLPPPVATAAGIDPIPADPVGMGSVAVEEARPNCRKPEASVAQVGHARFARRQQVDDNQRTLEGGQRLGHVLPIDRRPCPRCTGCAPSAAAPAGARR